jgi:hypothetical protein
MEHCLFCCFLAALLILAIQERISSVDQQQQFPQKYNIFFHQIIGLAQAAFYPMKAGF